MNTSARKLLVPVWMWVVCWLGLVPNLIAPQVPTYARVVLFVLAASMTVGLIYEHMDTPVYLDILDGLSTAADARGYSLIVTIFICSLLTVYWGLFPSTILQLIRESVRALLF